MERVAQEGQLRGTEKGRLLRSHGRRYASENVMRTERQQHLALQNGWRAPGGNIGIENNMRATGARTGHTQKSKSCITENIYNIENGTEIVTRPRKLARALKTKKITKWPGCIATGGKHTPSHKT